MEAKKIQLYAHPRSDPCRFIQNLCKHLQIDVDYHHIDLPTDEQKGDAYLKVNPNGKVPLIIDGDFTLTETFAIAKYLIDKYAPADNNIYPKDLKTRAVIDQYANLMNDLRFNQLRLVYAKIFLPQKGQLMPDMVVKDAEKVQHETYKYFEKILQKQSFIHGSNATVIDWMLAELVIAGAILRVNYSAKYPNILKFFENMKSLYPLFADDERDFNEMIQPIDIEYQNIDLDKGEQRSEAYLKLSPSGKVPLLQDGEFILPETFAIARYLIDNHSKGQDNFLYPADLKQRALVDMFAGTINDLRVNMIRAVYGKKYMPRQGIYWPESVIQDAEANYLKIFGEFNGLLVSERRSLCNLSDFTLVDLMLCQLIIDYDSLEINHPEVFPNLFKYAITITEKYPMVCEGYEVYNNLVKDYLNTQQ
ncbi:glutathione s-transferase [Stylonychia lemnae]|uniref:Glutathione s-transferase n=1 Tax=Stylonychia lemnae TaxID=5949 RepID=A0A078AJG4_STYLE|nr:glutathione s-transferase [Stylonychia lemnae]|eukprot:CDW81627.1 glutathione s-transferase [Stylonychia lemnae]